MTLGFVFLFSLLKIEMKRLRLASTNKVGDFRTKFSKWPLHLYPELKQQQEKQKEAQDNNSRNYEGFL